MPIQPAQPLVIPEKTLDKLWAKRIVIMAPAPNGEADAEITLLPYNDTGSVAEELTQTLNISGIMERAKDPTSNLAKAMYFLLLAIDDEYKAIHGS